MGRFSPSSTGHRWPVVVIVISAILAYARGFVRRSALDRRLDPRRGRGLHLRAERAAADLREIPYLGDFIGESCELGIMASFRGACSPLALVVISLFTAAVFDGGAAIRHRGLDFAGLGFLFGVARGVLLVVVALIAYDRVAGVRAGWRWCPTAARHRFFAHLQTSIEAQIPDDAPGLDPAALRAADRELRSAGVI